MFTPPEIHRNDRVTFSPAAGGIDNQEKTHPGIIDKVYPDGVCDIIVLFPGGNRGMECCRHHDDPYVAEHPDFIKEIDTGIYKLADSEVQQRLIYAKLIALEQRLANAQPDIEMIGGEDVHVVRVEQDTPKRKRGRPRKEDK